MREIDKRSLESKLAKVKALYLGAKTDGERSAAAAAVTRVNESLVRLQVKPQVPVGYRGPDQHYKYALVPAGGDHWAWKWVWKETAAMAA